MHRIRRNPNFAVAEGALDKSPQKSAQCDNGRDDHYPYAPRKPDPVPRLVLLYPGLPKVFV